MRLADVNVLLYAHREESKDHNKYRQWLEGELEATTGFAISEYILSSFIRIATHPRIFDPPTPLNEALAFASLLRGHANAIRLRPGERHWALFSELITKTGSRGNLIPDAYLAALAMEHGCEWITTDGDFARFPGLRWRHPLETAN